MKHAKKTIVELYDSIADTYDRDKFRLYRQCHEPAAEQLIAHRESIHSAIDIAVGTGLFWELAQKAGLDATLTLNDISPQMLAQAKSRLGEKHHYLNFALPELADNVPAGSIDLLCSHFIYSYVTRRETYELAKKLLRPGGFFSIVSSTQQCLVEIYDSPLGWTGKVLRVPEAVANSQTPKTHDHLISELKQNGFEIEEQIHVRPPVVLRSHQDIIEWAIDGGWALDFFVGAASIKRAGAEALLKVANLSRRLYPISAHMDFSVVLARWPGPA